MSNATSKICNISASSVSAGFPSPAADYMEKELDLNQFLIRNPDASFFIRVSGDSMVNAGIFDGDTLVIDRSIPPKNGSIILAILEEEFTVKRFEQCSERTYLVPENRNYQPIEVTGNESFQVWGVVTATIHKFI
ncbi:MAG: translesion error-prone DNA polymerase V autoproteolytic subunit [Lentisphaeria bacterium]|nr:translesion error-prone DNA polymerase V autoproteolytic subunit [Lentisphaeria bacterium]